MIRNMNTTITATPTLIECQRYSEEVESENMTHQKDQLSLPLVRARRGQEYSGEQQILVTNGDNSRDRTQPFKVDFNIKIIPKPKTKNKKTEKNGTTII